MNSSLVDPAVRLRMRMCPDGKVVMHHRWQDLLFLHWKVDPSLVQSWLPPGLTVDTFDGSAWVGVVPFKMRNIRFAGLPSLPWVSNFLELNVRTYAVDSDGIPGVWFLSLDANRWGVVQVARHVFHLPYFHAAMSCREKQTESEEIRFHYTNRRRKGIQKEVSKYEWSPKGDLFHAAPETLEFFLVERYVLFALNPRGRLSRGQVHHSPYPIQAAELHHRCDAPLLNNGIDLGNSPSDHILYSPGVDVRVFSQSAIS